MSGNSCLSESGEDIYSTLSTISFWVYAVLAFLLLIVLGILVYKRGNWVATVITLAYIGGYGMKGYTLSNFSILESASAEVIQFNTFFNLLIQFLFLLF